ncbi:FecR family protein [Methylobacillus gramineus]|uniref:FecR domain-containing protein n=1 Tax=Methylobacillus gramineus TaxID=755169 RepID=UPI001CFFD531|nr:FecR family protein [Methylobacillus gramineus]MCB5185061.1 FecR family protein [Methylobacillus gramineus]
MSNGAEQAQLRQQALEWQVMLWSGEVTPAEQAGFEAWLATGQEQQQAWAELQSIQQALQEIPAQAAGWLKDKPKAEKRRQLLQLLGITAIVGGSLPLVRHSDTWQDLSADYSTHTGEQRRLLLPDGSQLTLNTSSAVDIDFNAQERRLILHRGEIHLASAPDIARPLKVETVHGMAQALGTRFNVRLKPDETQVSVQDGTVHLQTLYAGNAVTLESGWLARFSAYDIQAALPNGNEVAWLEGKLVAERMQLDAFLDELARYRPGVIRYSNAVGKLIVSGVYPLADTDRILESLLYALPLRIDYFSRYWVSVRTL